MRNLFVFLSLFSTISTVAFAQDQADQQIVKKLQSDFFASVPESIAHPTQGDERWLQSVNRELQKNQTVIDRPQVILTVDRNSKSQEMFLVVISPDGKEQIVGGSKVSTGKPGRIEHFKTPTGVFENSSAVLGYRAEGTFNQNHIRGLGLKGMRVWDFGWQETENWRHRGEMSKIRLEMHATDPANLEHRIGNPDSEGCIRVHASMNKFLDHYGIIDYQYEQAAQSDRRFAALLSRSREPTPLAGDRVLVFDSSQD